MKDDVSGLTLLGQSGTEYKYEEPTAEMLEWFPNRYPGSVYEIHLECPEFTSLCPKTGQPDFATITITYTPSDKCLETKSLKLYLFAYRNYKGFMETITNKIADDIASVIDPVHLTVVGKFRPRGGISLTVEATRFGRENGNRSEE